MRKLKVNIALLSLSGALAIAGCGSDSSIGGGDKVNTDADVVVLTRVENDEGYINILNANTAHNSTNINGIDINPTQHLAVYKDDIFVAGEGNKITKYIKKDGILEKSAELSSGAGSNPTSMIFASDTKAYVSLTSAGQLMVINPTDMTITNYIDLSAYAMDANGNVDGNDTNPEPTSGVIRDGKLYIGMFQVDNFQTVKCRGKASLLVIDVATDTILNHTTDDRTCSTARPLSNLGIFMDENKDIYVNNIAGFGYYPGLNSGILRIKNGQDSFDPDYYFSMTDLEGLEMGNGKTTGFTTERYTKSGKLYVTLNFPSLGSNPPDYINDRNTQPYVLDIYDKSVTKLNLPPSNIWTMSILSYKDKVLYGLSTTTGDGIFRYDPATGEGDQTPYISTVGIPVFLFNY